MFFLKYEVVATAKKIANYSNLLDRFVKFLFFPRVVESVAQPVATPLPDPDSQTNLES